MLFQFDYDGIFCCNVTDKDQKTFNWRELDFKLMKPLPANYLFEIILGWNQILFVFNLKQRYIECIDLLHPDDGPFEYYLTEEFYFQQIIHDNENNLHLLKLNQSNQLEIVTSHFKISLFDLIPLKILRINQKEHESLIIGYCKKCEKENKLQVIPTYLKKLTLNFYPMFL